ncbi:MAG: OmpA family protein [Desulfobacterales bacterium]|jgi:outer membrane protein OmpA-like peptidoglycan-associated protein|nr:OmpA family protein [Desulfobacterales bacterium]
MKTLNFLSLMLMLFFCGATAAEGSKYISPEDPAAVLAAEKALAISGPQRGAISIKPLRREIISRSIEIKGVSKSTGGAGLNLTADIRDADKILKDLGAKKTDIGYDLSLSGDILFDFDKWDIKPEAESELMKLADALNKLGEKHVAVEGHTDSVGSDAYNLELSGKRAQSVKSWLIIKGGVSKAKISAQGLGESKPVAPNVKTDGSDNPEGRASNRRVEIHIN